MIHILYKSLHMEGTYLDLCKCPINNLRCIRVTHWNCIMHSRQDIASNNLFRALQILCDKRRIYRQDCMSCIRFRMICMFGLLRKSLVSKLCKCQLGQGIRCMLRTCIFGIGHQSTRIQFSNFYRHLKQSGSMSGSFLSI